MSKAFPISKDKVVINCLKDKPRGEYMGNTPSDITGYVICDGKDGKRIFEVALKDFVYCDDGWWRAVDFQRELPGGDQVSAITSDLKKKLAPLKNGNITEIYTQFVTEPIRNGEGMKTYHAFMRTKADKKFTVAALAVNPTEVFEVVKTLIEKEQPDELIFALNRDLKRPRGIDLKYKKMLTVFKYTGPGKGSWEIFVIPFEGKEVSEPIKDNHEWNDKLMREIRIAGLTDIVPNAGDPVKDLMSNLGGFGMSVKSGEKINFRDGANLLDILNGDERDPDKVNGKLAYLDKIKIESSYENEKGFFYEGNIQTDKLSPGIKLILDKFKIDINNMSETLNFVKEALMIDISIVDAGDGYFRGIAKGCIKDHPQDLVENFPKRRSKTRAYLESVEIVLEASVRSVIQRILKDKDFGI